MKTPSGSTITATSPDGTSTDVTESVMALYDLVLSSMDWGSGFLTYEDAVPVAHIARVCGFEKSDEAERYLQQELHEREQEAYWKANPEASRLHFPNPLPDHEHVFSSVGRCMLRLCNANKEQA